MFKRNGLLALLFDFAPAVKPGEVEGGELGFQTQRLVLPAKFQLLKRLALVNT